MENWQRRVVEEHIELTTKLEKLNAFIDTNEFNSLPHIDRRYMTMQSLAMAQYLLVLDSRITRFDIIDDESIKEPTNYCPLIGVPCDRHEEQFCDFACHGCDKP